MPRRDSSNDQRRQRCERHPHATNSACSAACRRLTLLDMGRGLASVREVADGDPAGLLPLGKVHDGVVGEDQRPPLGCRDQLERIWGRVRKRRYRKFALLQDLKRRAVSVEPAHVSQASHSNKKFYAPEGTPWALHTTTSLPVSMPTLMPLSAHVSLRRAWRPGAVGGTSCNT